MNTTHAHFGYAAAKRHDVAWCSAPTGHRITQLTKAVVTPAACRTT